MDAFGWAWWECDLKEISLSSARSIEEATDGQSVLIFGPDFITRIYHEWVEMSVTLLSRMLTSERDVKILLSRMLTLEGEVTLLLSRMLTLERDVTLLLSWMLTSERDVTLLLSRMLPLERDVTLFLSWMLTLERDVTSVTDVNFRR